LQSSEPFLCFFMVGAPAYIHDENRNKIRKKQSDHGCQKNTQENRNYFYIIDHILTVLDKSTRMGNCSTHKSANQRMRGRGRNPKPPSEKIPDNSSYNPRENYFEGNELFIYGFGNRVSDFKFADPI